MLPALIRTFVFICLSIESIWRSDVSWLVSDTNTSTQNVLGQTSKLYIFPTIQSQRFAVMFSLLWCSPVTILWPLVEHHLRIFYIYCNTGRASIAPSRQWTIHRFCTLLSYRVHFNAILLIEKLDKLPPPKREPIYLFIFFFLDSSRYVIWKRWKWSLRRRCRLFIFSLLGI